SVGGDAAADLVCPRRLARRTAGDRHGTAGRTDTRWSRWREVTHLLRTGGSWVSMITAQLRAARSRSMSRTMSALRELPGSQRPPARQAAPSSVHRTHVRASERMNVESDEEFLRGGQDRPHDTGARSALRYPR